VGLIHDPHLAEGVITGGHADLVAIGRALLDNPQWPLAAARALGVPEPLALLQPAQAHWLRNWTGFA
jgi:2,4-dienoyl-CoA reductase-like NADH-dependent reductase (Old Yellow Enzyme family)